MRASHALFCCVLFSLFLTGCGAPRPASIRENGLKPINNLKYYPDLTESERRQFAKTSPHSSTTPAPPASAKVSGAFDTISKDSN